MKFSDEQLSRILSQHAGRSLIRCGAIYFSDTKHCLVQAALCRMWLPFIVRHSKLVENFDDEYNPNWSTENFISWLGKQGVL